MYIYKTFADKLNDTLLICPQYYTYPMCTILYLPDAHIIIPTRCAQYYTYPMCTILYLPNVHNIIPTRCAQYFTYPMCTIYLPDVHNIPTRSAQYYTYPMCTILYLPDDGYNVKPKHVTAQRVIFVRVGNKLVYTTTARNTFNTK
jgi:hypothetical protein